VEAIVVKYLWRALSYLRRYWLLALGAFLGLLVSTVARLVIPRLTQMIIDQGIEAGQMNVVLRGSVLTVGMAVAGSIFTFVQGVLSARTAQGIAYDLRNSLYAKIQSLSFGYHDRAQTGQLLTRATSDVEMVHHFVGMGFVQLLSAILMMIGSIALLFATDWQLALIVLVLVPLGLGRCSCRFSNGWPNSTPCCRRTWSACGSSRPSPANPTRRSAIPRPTRTYSTSIWSSGG